MSYDLRKTLGSSRPAFPLIGTISVLALAIPPGTAAWAADTTQQSLSSAAASLTPEQREAAKQQLAGLSTEQKAQLASTVESMTPAEKQQLVETALTTNTGSESAAGNVPVQAKVVAQEVATPVHAQQVQSAAQPYSLVGSAKKFSSIRPFFTQLSSARIRQQAPSYSTASALSGRLRFRGLDITVSSEPGSTAMRLRIPGTADRVFTGVTRDHSLLLMAADFKGRDNLARQFLRASVARTSRDPIAGNPSSLLSRMLSSDFRANSTQFQNLSELQRVALGDWGSLSVLGMHQWGGTTIDTASLPIWLGHRFSDRWEVFFDTAPALQYIDHETVFSSSMAAGIRTTLLNTERWNWRISASARIGIAGSNGLEALGGFGGGALTSEVSYSLDERTKIALGNTVAHYESLPISYTDYRLRYDLSNTGFRNGISLAREIGTVADRKVTAILSIVDSRFSGSKLAVNSWQEYNATIAIGKNSPLLLGLTYLNGEKGVQGISARVGFNF